MLKKFGLQDKVQGITKIKGKVFDSKEFYPVKIIPLFHPAVATYNANTKGDLKKDFQVLKQFKDIEKTPVIEKEVKIPKPKQEKLF